MPLEVAVWRIDEQLHRLEQTQLNLESRLQDLLDQDITIANPGWMVIGREVVTDYAGRIDILAIDSAAALVVIELKRDRTPRDIVAQVLDYGSWVSQLPADRIGLIYQDYLARFHPDAPQQSLDAAFQSRFGQMQSLDELNARHELVIVSSNLDPATERIVEYLSDSYGVSINALFFQVFSDQGREYIVRTWLHDPNVVQSDAPLAAGRLQWNNEYYVSFGEGDSRNWEDARAYGFVSGGGGEWYVQSLRMLEPGNRIWVHVPGKGYVGVGEVISSAVPVADFLVETSSGSRPLVASDIAEPGLLSPTHGEHLVGISWIMTLPVSEAIWERGFFANQNTTARPRASSWQFTITRLKEQFRVS